MPLQRKCLSIDALGRFAKFHGIDISGIQFERIGGFPIDAGVAVKLNAADFDRSKPILTIPLQLVLSHTYIEEQSKMDGYLREILVANRPFSFSPRGATIIFLLMKMTNGVGHKCPWSEYVKFLPEHVPLPTNWTADERDLLIGTSLEPAVIAKLNVLQAEFEAFKSVTEDIPWCKKAWWDAEVGLSAETWFKLDALYRSRVLEIPDLGPSMVPCLDFCNHDPAQNAYYEVENENDCIFLRLRDDLLSSLNDAVEVTINYGSSKGASEMVFTYGFIDADQESARSLVLNIRDMNSDAPLDTIAKQRLMNSPPTLVLKDSDGDIEWESDFIWLLSVNTEDGLDIRVLQETDGTKSLQALFDGSPLTDISALQDLLQDKPLYPVFKLRAATLVVAKIEEQFQRLLDAGARLHELRLQNMASDHALHVSQRLRALEADLLKKMLDILETQKQELLTSDVVLQYLEAMQADDEALKASEEIDDENDFT